MRFLTNQRGLYNSLFFSAARAQCRGECLYLINLHLFFTSCCISSCLYASMPCLMDPPSLHNSMCFVSNCYISRHSLYSCMFSFRALARYSIAEELSLQIVATPCESAFLLQINILLCKSTRCLARGCLFFTNLRSSHISVLLLHSRL